LLIQQSLSVISLALQTKIFNIYLDYQDKYILNGGDKFVKCFTGQSERTIRKTCTRIETMLWIGGILLSGGGGSY
jgi:hypothetical protein